MKSTGSWDTMLSLLRTQGTLRAYTDEFHNVLQEVYGYLEVVLLQSDLSRGKVIESLQERNAG